MADTRVLSNQRITVWIGPDTAIANYQKPTLAEVQSMENVSESIKFDGFDFGHQASGQSDDRGLADAAGSQSRSFLQFGGRISFFAPKREDQTGAFRRTRNIVKTPRTKLAIVVRLVKLNSLGAVASDVVNAYRVISDGHKFARNAETSYSYSVNFRPQDDVGVNRILPASPATPVTLLPAGPIAAVIGKPTFLRATYQGLNITVGAEYVSSNPLVAYVTKHGIIVPLSVGTTNITPSYPGSAAGTATVVNVAAA